MARFMPPITGTRPRDLSVGAVAAELNCSPKTVRKFAAQRKLIGYKVGRDWRFTRQALDQFKRPPAPHTPPPPVRLAARRGGELAGWHDFD